MSLNSAILNSSKVTIFVLRQVFYQTQLTRNTDCLFSLIVLYFFLVILKKDKLHKIFKVEVKLITSS